MLSLLSRWFSRRGRESVPRGAVVEEFEPRILYSADLQPWMAASAADVQLVDEPQVATCAIVQERRREIVFVDAAVQDPQALIDAIRTSRGDVADLEVVQLRADANGLAQIGDALAARQDVDAVHIVSHGAAGQLRLGNGMVGVEQLRSAGPEGFAAWRSALGEDADLLLWGCNVGAGSEGQAFLGELAALSGADVAASDDTTGSAARGGDWTLEASLGLVDAGAMMLDATAMQGWQGSLATFVVTNTNDSGAGSLRQALIDANASAGLDTIAFNITGTGTHTIDLTAALPQITGAVVIDGTTDDSFAANGSRPAIILDGNNSFTGDGLVLASGSGGSTIRGLVIRDFSGDAIEIQVGSNGNTIAGNYLGGLNASGTTAGGAERNTQSGLRVLSNGNVIGGTTAADRNVIAGNGADGIRIQDASGNLVIGNFIGVDASGATALANLSDGIEINGGTANQVGQAGSGNVISGNAVDGIYIAGAGTGQIVLANFIGTDQTGATAIANASNGVEVGGGSGHRIGQVGAGNLISGNTLEQLYLNGSDGNVVQANRLGPAISGTAAPVGYGGEEALRIDGGADNNLIGGVQAGQGNVLAYTALVGVYVGTGQGNALLGNTIQGSTTSSGTGATWSGLGIDLGAQGVQANDAGDADAGANGLQNYPVLASAQANSAGTTIAGTLNSNAGTTYRIEFYANRPATADGTGYGEGERYLGFISVTTDGSGNSSFNATLSNVWVNAGDRVTATATVDLGGGSYGSTSEFAANVTATTSGIIVVDTVSDTADGNTGSIASLVASRGADGRISLREAIVAANNTANGATPDRIVFAIDGTGTHTIELTAALPQITGAVVIDGTTDDSFAANGSRPAIVIDGNDAADGFVLTTGSSGSTIRGLVIRDFDSPGIALLSGSDGNTIVGNYIGRLTSAGEDAGAGEGNSAGGIFIESGSDNHVIGGTSAADRNVLSGNATDGLSLMGSGVLVHGNYFGVNAAGTTTIGNGGQGIWVGAGSNNIIGGAAAGQGNLIGGTTVWAGISVHGPATGTVIQGNSIGTDATGTLNLGNAGPGIWLANGSTGTLVGGANAGEGNRIAFSNYDGIATDNNAGTSGAFLGNLIYANNGAAIEVGNDGPNANDAGDADTGANHLQNFPVLQSASVGAGTISVAGSLNSTPGSSFRVEFFASPTQDLSGQGQARTYLGHAIVSTDGSGNAVFGATFGASVAAGQYVSATATDLGTMTTSEMSFTVVAAAGLPGAGDDSVSLSEDTTATGNVLGNDAQGVGATLLGGVANGSLTLQADGSYSYTPRADWSGTDSLQYLATHPGAGLAHYWSLQAGAADAVGGANGTIVGGPATVAGRDGNALVFDGVDDHVALPDITYGSEMTLSFYFRVDDNSGTGLQYFYSHGPIPNSNQPNAFHVAFVESDFAVVGQRNQIVTTIWDSDDNTGQIFIDAASLVGDGQWHHYTVTTQPGSGTRVYLDGVLRGSAGTGGGPIDPAGTAYIGARSDLDPTRFLNAGSRIDSVSLYSRALNDAEVASLTSGGPEATVSLNVAAVNDAPRDLVAVPALPEADLIGVYTFTSPLAPGQDNAGGNAPMTLVGNPGTVTAPDGSAALDLSGGQHGRIDGITTGGPMTIAGQVRFDSTGAWQRVVDLGEAYSTGPYAIYVGRLATSDDLTFTIEKDIGGGNYSVFRATAPGAIVNGSWMHFAATLDASGTMSLYVNGNLAATTAGVVPELTVRSNNFIGRSNWGGDAPLDGAIDNLVIARGALTASQVAVLYQQSNVFTVPENAANGTVLGTVVVADPDAGDTFTFALSDSAGGRFAIGADGTITVADGSRLDFEASPSHTLTVVITDATGATRSELFTVNLTDANDAPVVTSNGGGATAAVSVAETTTAVTTVTATDQDAGATGSFGIVGGADAARFVIDANSGALSFISAPDFEAPGDANADNVYEVTVRVSDGNGGFDDQVISVTVTDVSSTLVVTTTADDNDAGIVSGNATHTAEWLNAHSGGAVSLREAIVAANNTAGANTITFNIAGSGARTIDVTSALPVITGTVLIDGYTQGGAQVNTLATGSNAVLTVMLRGPGGGTIDGLTLGAGSDGSTIRGLVIGGFRSGIEVISGGNTITGNWIGLNASGTAAAANTWGVRVNGSGSNIIGGSAAALRNVISGSTADGVYLFNGSSNTVQGNYLGTNAAGTAAVANSVGLQVHVGSGFNQIGGGAAGEGNVISGNATWGIKLRGGSGFNVMEGNTIGLNAAGSAALANAAGIFLDSDANNNRIGGTGASDGNIIAGNTGAGVLAYLSTGGTSSGNAILGNRIEGNGGLGIDLSALPTGADGVTPNDAGDADTGPNGLQNHPVLATAVASGASTTITGSINSTANTTLRIEFFANPAGGGDPSGHGEGRTFLGFVDVTTDGAGNATFSTTLNSVAIAVGDLVTATATVNLGGGTFRSTSEFAANIVAAAPNVAPVNTVPGAQTVAEEATLALGGLSVADANGNLASVQLTVTSGTLGVSLAGGATLGAGANGSASLTLNGTAAQINAALATLTYQGNADFNGADTLTIVSADVLGASDTDTVTINVTAVNDAPVITSNGGGATAAVSVAEGSIAVTTVTRTDVDGGTPTYTIIGGADAARFTIDASTGVLTFINAPDFEAPGDAGGDNVYDVTVQVSDGAGGTATQSIAVTVTNVNEAPVNLLPGAQTVAEDTVLAIPGLSVADVDGNVTSVQLGVGQGRLTVDLSGGATLAAGANGSATLTLAGSQAQINAALATLAYQGNADFNGVDVLTVLTTDAGGATDSGVVGIGVTAVNDAPQVNVVAPQATDEDVAVRFGTAFGNAITVGDVDAGAQWLQLTVTPANGVLDLGTTAGVTLVSGTGTGDRVVTLQGTAAALNAALNGLTYRPDANYNGAASLQFTLDDLGNAGAGGALVTTATQAITVRPVNDAPSLAMAPATVDESAPAGSLVALVASNDPDVGDTAQFALLQGGGGRFIIDAATGRVSLAQGAVLDFETEPSIDLVVQVTDAGGLSTQQTLRVNVRDVAELPPGGPDLPPSPPAPPPSMGPAPPPAAEPGPLPPAPGGPPAPELPPAGTGRDPIAGIDRPARVDAPTPRDVDVPRYTVDLEPPRRNAEARAAFTLVSTVNFDLAGTGDLAFVPASVTFDAWKPELATVDMPSLAALTARRVVANIDLGDLGDFGELDLSPRAGLPGSLLEALTDPVRVASVTFTAGFVWWLTRSGGLITTMLMGAPAWRHVDLLPVLARVDDDEPQDDDDRDDDDSRFAPTGLAADEAGHLFEPARRESRHGVSA